MCRRGDTMARTARVATAAREASALEDTQLDHVPMRAARGTRIATDDRRTRAIRHMRSLCLPRTILLLLVLAGPTVGLAQTSIPPLAVRPVAPSGPTVEGQEVEGLIRRIDPAARTITLDDGEDYFVPAGLGDVAALGEGARVKLRFGVDGGRNFATALQVRR
jgi:hypothetical protein